MICNKYAHGVTVSELADEYFLSLDSIKKIIYSKKNKENLTYAPTLISAVQYANVGMFEEWIQCYFLFTQKETLTLHDLMKVDPVYFGVVKFPLRLIQSDGMKIGENNVDEYISNAAVLPPLIIKYENRKFYSIVQKELFITLKQRKVNAYPSIIVLKESADYKIFMRHYGNYLFFIDKI